MYQSYCSKNILSLLFNIIECTLVCTLLAISLWTVRVLHIDSLLIFISTNFISSCFFGKTGVHTCSNSTVESTVLKRQTLLIESCSSICYENGITYCSHTFHVIFTPLVWKSDVLSTRWDTFGFLANNSTAINTPYFFFNTNHNNGFKRSLTKIFVHVILHNNPIAGNILVVCANRWRYQSFIREHYWRYRAIISIVQKLFWKTCLVSREIFRWVQ